MIKDKISHIVYSYAICLTICLLFQYVKNISLYSFFITLAIGVGKEIYDKKIKKEFVDYKDLIADFVGIIFGLAIFNISI